jgi:putative transposase
MNEAISISCSPDLKIAPGQMMRMFKSISGREVFRGKPAFKKELWSGECWSYGYTCGTVMEAEMTD